MLAAVGFQSNGRDDGLGFKLLLTDSLQMFTASSDISKHHSEPESLKYDPASDPVQLGES